MEAHLELSVEDRLRALATADSNLFYFLNSENVPLVQYNFKILENSMFQATMETLGAKTDKVNEDSFLYKELPDQNHLFAALDGASSQKPILGLEKYGIKGSAYISHLLSFGFSDQDYALMSQTAPSLDADEIMKYMNSWLYSKMVGIEGVNYSDVLTIPGMAASFVSLDLPNEQGSLAHVADTVTALSYNNGSIVVISLDQNCKFDQQTMEFRHNLMKKHGCSNLAQMDMIPEAKDECRKELQESFRRKINQPNGCGILNGMPELVKNNAIYSCRFPLRGIKEILMFSDGALLPYGGRGISDHNAVMNFVADNDFGQASLPKGASCLDADPHRVKIPRIKHRDDATVLRIQFAK